MRGKHLRRFRRKYALRITPAHAGKTRARARHFHADSDHPRACGENRSTGTFTASFGGSPPRMRGKRKVSRRGRAEVRITPAHAGKTMKMPTPRGRPTDHPRACGENEEPQIPQLPNVGSPPRMRGKQPPKQDTARASRITPAHAGKTSISSSLRGSIADHPRACGENYSLSCGIPMGCGSPPRMRGKRTRVRNRTANARITPAHAGKTSCFIPHQLRPADHPRACGENRMPWAARWSRCGSPPRMRGKPAHHQPAAVALRITPAHAGKTSRAAAERLERTDHPRACGENTFHLRTLSPPGGSPPRMRGKHPRYPAHSAQKRITPAHAGKTRAS